MVAYAPEAAVWGEAYITEKVETKAGWQFPSPEEDWMRGYPQELEDFVDAIRDGRPPRSGAALARDVVEVIYAGLSLGGHRTSGGADRPMIPFAKGHGLGNDYLVIDQANLPGPLSERAIVRICDRNWGVGSDGILLLVPSPRAALGSIFNPDGSEAEKSGNGLRIFAKYLRDHGHARSPTFTVDTKGGLVECECREEAGRVTFVTVEMGHATFRAADIPMNGVAEEAVGCRWCCPDGPRLTVTAVSVGNPHCVVFRDQLDEAEVKHLGPAIERHPGLSPAYQRPVCPRARARRWRS